MALFHSYHTYIQHMLKMRGFQGLKKFLIAEGPKAAVLFFVSRHFLGQEGEGEWVKIKMVYI